MRGKHIAGRIIQRLTGITPADAGKTAFGRFRPALATDHPRGCGENSILLKLHVAAEGSPPRMRGKLQAIVDALPQIRITPADAGKTVTRAGDTTGETDHPRGCGENLSDFQQRKGFVGSPPRMRGKHISANRNALLPGITPADAGKTCFSVAGAEPQRDHPRGCGENSRTRNS